MKGIKGFPRIDWVGTEGEFNVIVMELLGPNLQDLLDACGGRFSIKTTAILAL